MGNAATIANKFVDIIFGIIATNPQETIKIR
jgi:hypothetical protein